MSNQRLPQPQAFLMPTPIDIGEPHNIGIAYYQTKQELACYFRSLRAISDGRLTVIVGLRDGHWTAPTELGPNVRWVFTADASTVAPHALAGWCEPDPFRAVAATMLNLRPHEGLILLFPTDWSGPSAEYLIEMGRRWRATLEAPETDEFYALMQPE